METVHASADSLPFERRELRCSRVDLDTHGRRRLRGRARRARKGAACWSAVRLHRRAPVLRGAALPLLRRQGRARAPRGLLPCRALRRRARRSCPRVFGRGSARRISRSASSSRPSWTQASRSSASRSGARTSTRSSSRCAAAGERRRALGRAARRRGGRVPRHGGRAGGDDGAAAAGARRARRGRARAPGHHEPLRAPGRGVGGSRARRARGRHHRHGQRQDAGLQPAGARRNRSRPEGARAVPLSDEGSRAGPGAQPDGPRRARRAAGHLRRGHADRSAAPGANVGQRHPVQPGHAPPRRPAPSRPLGGRAREPRVRHRRRGARVPRRVRLARCERAATPPAAGGRLPGRAAVPARVRDDREPRRAGVDTDGARGDGRLRRLGAAGGADDRALEPAGDRRGAQPPRQRAR